MTANWGRTTAFQAVLEHGQDAHVTSSDVGAGLFLSDLSYGFGNENAMRLAIPLKSLLRLFAISRSHDLAITEVGHLPKLGRLHQPVERHEKREIETPPPVAPAASRIPSTNA